MEATINSYSSGLSTSSSSVHEPIPHGKEKGIIKKKLKLFELFKKAHIIKTEEQLTVTHDKSILDFKNFYAKLALKGILWLPCAIITLDLIARVSDIIAEQLSYNCQYPPWSVGISVAAGGISAGVAFITTKMSYDVDKKNKRDQLIHEKEAQEVQFARFTAAFDAYKKQVEELHTQTRIIYEQSSDIELTENEDPVDKDDTADDYPVDKQIIALENSLNDCIEKLNQCSLQQQNAIFSREMWLSQLIYLLKKALKSIDKMKEKEKGALTQSKLPTPSLVKLVRKVSKHADVLVDESPSRDKLTISERKSKKNFEGEMASRSAPSIFQESATKREKKKKEKFEEIWKQVELICGPMEYIALNKKIVSSDGKVYFKEKYLPRSNSAEDEVVLDINDGEK